MTQGPHILLIDDDADIHDAVRMILEPRGYVLSCCRTGPEGMAAVRRDPPDLILLDIMLSTPTEGFHLAYEIQRDDVLREIPIVMLSAISEKMGMDFASETGTEYIPASVFVCKPFGAQTLIEAVETALLRRAEARR